MALSLILATMPFSCQNKLRMGASETLKPAVGASKAVSKGIFGIFRRKNLSRENQQLKIQAKQLQVENLLKKDLQAENSRLRNILGLRQRLHFKTYAAIVVGKDPTNWYKVVIIDKGALAAIKKDMPVISTDGLVGKIVEVGRNYSKVLLLNDYSLRIVGLVERSRQDGVIFGTASKYCKMRYLALDADIKVGDSIISAGTGGVYPKGLKIGKVVKIAKEFDGLSYYALIEPYAKLSKLEELIIIDAK